MKLYLYYINQSCYEGGICTDTPSKMSVQTARYVDRNTAKTPAFGVEDER